MIRTSKQLGFWMAIVAAIVAASQTIPSSLPGWVGEYMAWAAVALGAGLGVYTAGSPAITLPAERREAPGG